MALGCGGPKTTTRMVDDPSGQATEYGGPKNTQYSAQVDVSQTQAQITVFQRSECAVIPVTVMQRYEETLSNGKVVQRTPVTKRQVAGDPKGVVGCDQTYARNVEVFLASADSRRSLGQTDARGVVNANLAAVFQVGSYDKLPDQVRVVLRPVRAQEVVDAGVVSLAELKRRDGRIVELLQKMEGILAKGETGASPQEVTDSYQIYEQLQALAPADARVLGVSARFWELFFGRKKEEARVKMERNLAALSEAKDTLKVMGDAAIPIYVQAAVNSGNLDQSSLEWASLRLIQALRTSHVCVGFNFANVPNYNWPTDARLAAQYVQYGYGNNYAALLQRSC